MSLKVIGSGFGRTGTKSLKAALEFLGFGPCHHMHEVMDNPSQVAHWQAAFSGQTVDWNQVFDGYQSQVDWPGAHFWRELAETFPDAKIVHSLRPEEAWWNSFRRTIGKLFEVHTQLEFPPHICQMLDVTSAALRRDTFPEGADDREAALRSYRLRTEQVRQAIAAQRLLVFDVAEGWEPLCRFLEVPVPDIPFPHHNLRHDFWEALGGEPT